MCQGFERKIRKHKNRKKTQKSKHNTKEKNKKIITRLGKHKRKKSKKFLKALKE